MSLNEFVCWIYRMYEELTQEVDECPPNLSQSKPVYFLG
uniref:Uncharacterized protein n=1 Tax=Heterorhabditis bacteriophora TaxID=37862 RepID=A0A1I7X5G9_HETBA